ncbi:thioredoxin domain-containing protein [Rubidibacter lacunae]|nr:thioredoxin domain-containing protein [Rubidibacter lacunae]
MAINIDLLKRSFEKIHPQAIALAVIGLFAIATLLLAQPQLAATSPSLASGLVALKTLARDATPYPDAMANPQPTLIEFYANWCTTCQALAPDMMALRDRFATQVNFVMLDIDDPQWSSQIREFGVNGVPQLTLLNGDRVAVDTLVGKVPQSILARRLSELVEAG